MHGWVEMKTWAIEVLFRAHMFWKNPRQTWDQLPVSDEKQLVKEIACLVIPSTLARLLGWGYWGFGAALGHALLWYILLVGLIWGIGRSIAFLIPFMNADIEAHRSLQLSVYSFLPFLLGAILYINPMLGQIVPAFILVGLYWFYHGIGVYSNLTRRQNIIITVFMGLIMWLGLWILGLLTGGLVFSRN